VPPTGCTDGGLTIAFDPMYSAFDGTHTFAIPAVVNGSKTNVTWSADETMVGMQADTERPNEVLITALKPGFVVINVQSVDGTKCGSSLLTISAAKESDWEIGSKRYNDGQSVHLAAAASTGTGSPLETSDAGGPACTNCHGETATDSVFTDVSHTPEQTGGFSDQDLLGIILRGEFPDGGFFDDKIVSYEAWHGFHRWTDITPDQQTGIITYLRSLTPADQKGQVNFGAFDEAGSGDDQGDATVTPPADASMDATVDAPAVVDAAPDVSVVVDAAPVDAAPADAGSVADAGSTGDGATE